MSLKYQSLALIIIISWVVTTTAGDESLKFCDNTNFDTIFSDQKHQIRLIRGDWVWTYNQDQKRVYQPVRQNLEEVYRLQSLVYIPAVPSCEAQTYCGAITRAKDLVIMLFHVKDRDFVGSYQVKRVVDGNVVSLENNGTGLPLGLVADGNMYAPSNEFWPRELAKNGDRFNKKYTFIAYNAVKYELIVLANGQQTDGQICYNEMDGKIKWSEGWKCKALDRKWVYSGLFVIGQNTYVWATNHTKTNRLFTYSQHELLNTNVDIHTYMGCKEYGDDGGRDVAGMPGVDSASAHARDKEARDKSNSVVWFAVGISCVIVVVVVFVVMAFMGVRTGRSWRKPLRYAPDPSHSQSPSASGSTSSKAVDNKGKEVDDSMIGVLDSKVDWVMKVSSPSQESVFQKPDRKANNMKAPQGGSSSPKKSNYNPKGSPKK
jgi:hypothetical protein